MLRAHRQGIDRARRVARARGTSERLDADAEAGLLGLNLAVLARLFAWNGQGAPRRGPAALFAAAVGIAASLELRSAVLYASSASRVARAQEAAARAAVAARECAVVEYHKASSVPSALLFGYGRPPVDGGDLAVLQGDRNLFMLNHPGVADDLKLSDAQRAVLHDLLPQLNVKLIPQLDKLPKGVRIVSHAFDMDGVTPDKVETVDVDGSGYTIYLWTTPLKKEGDGKKTS